MTRIHLSAAVGAVAWFVGLNEINEQRLAAATAEEIVTLSEEPSTAATNFTDAAADAPQLVKDAVVAGTQTLLTGPAGAPTSIDTIVACSPEPIPGTCTCTGRRCTPARPPWRASAR